MSEDLYKVIEDAALRLASRQRYEQTNRLALLTIHGLIGLVVGIFLLRDGLPFTWEHVISDPFWKTVAALAPVVGGSILLLGLLANRLLAIEAVGMCILFVWDLCIAVVVYASTHNPSSIPAGTRPSTYPVAVYGGLGALMLVHIVTLMTFLAQGQRHGRG